MHSGNLESPSQSLTSTQHAAVRRSRELSQIILGDHPEIAQDYRDGLSYREIAIKYSVDKTNHVGIRVARESVRLAIKNLIPDEERSKLAYEHEVMSGIKNRDQRKGAHGLSPKEKSANARLGFLFQMINKTGIFALSKAERVAAVKKSALEGGKVVPWDAFIDPESGLSEGEYCDRLSQKPQYQFLRNGKVLVKLIEIANLLNQKFHGGKQVRTKMSVSHRGKKFKLNGVAQ